MRRGLLLGFIAACTVGAASAASIAPARAATATGGVTLDGYGGLHPFGGMQLDTSGAPGWPGWDIARAVALNPDGPGGYTLDGYGGVHAFGGAPTASGYPYWKGWDIARALVITGTSGSAVAGYTLDGYGGVHAFGGAPTLSGFTYWHGWDIARGLVITTDGTGTPDGGDTLDAWGDVHPFGSAPSLANLPYFPWHNVYQQLHVSGGVAYAVGLYGVVTADGGTLAPAWSGYSDWGRWNILRDIVLASPAGGSATEPSSAAATSAWTSATQSGGVVLDGYGGLHPFGATAVDVSNATTWNGWDIARAVALNPRGPGGWTLDGYGGVHTFGGSAAARGTPYWANWDIARAIDVVSVGANGPVGYELDGYGGVHPFGGAPALSGYPYWRGTDIARGLAITTDPSGTPNGGYTLDGYGGIHAFGAAPAILAAGYYPGHDVDQRLHIVDGAAYVVGRWGVVQAAGGATPLSPDWTGYSDWGSFDILRDIALLGPWGGAGAAPPQPSSPAAAATYRVMALGSYQVPGVAYDTQSMSMTCEEAALQMAVSHLGVDTTQQAILDIEGVNESVPGVGPAYTSADPEVNFVGNPNGPETQEEVPGAYEGAIAKAANGLGVPVVFAGINLDPQTLYLDVEEGHPAVVWISVDFAAHATQSLTNGVHTWPFSHAMAHVVTLLGVDPYNRTVLIDNPIPRQQGSVRYWGINWVPMSDFQTAFTVYWNQAVVVQ